MYVFNFPEAQIGESKREERNFVFKIVYLEKMLPSKTKVLNTTVKHMDKIIKNT